MRTVFLIALILSSVWLCIGSPVGADVTLSALFSDNMVLQRGVAVPIWGTADPGERVTVMLGGGQATVTANSEGRWIVRLHSLKAGGPLEITIDGKNTITLQNVTVGDVWVCSGQSNMAWPVKLAGNPEQEIAGARYPMIRLFTVEKKVAEQPLEDTHGNWVECSPESVPGFSAVAYFFGRDLHKSLNVPIGLINTSWGGTPAEAWTSLPMLESDPDFKPILDRWEQIIANYPRAKEDYDAKLAQWRQDAEKAKSDGKPEPRKPWPPTGPDSPHRPAALYNGMIAPLMPYAIKGAIWYQGESNASRAYQYRTLFPAMIRNWRADWSQGFFPFLLVQLANWAPVNNQPMDDYWAELREAQLMSLRFPNTGMAVTIDIGDPGNIHPANKQEVGRRLALAAKRIAYGKNVAYSGPIYRSMTVEGNKIRLRFRLVYGGLVTKDGGPLKGFTIAGKDRKFVAAEARIDGTTIVVWSDQVPNPVAVRYAWAINPKCNLCNKAGLPASPFRTDDWPGLTVDKL